ncbi:MAG: T9SS type A sorting domain-containing protein [Muribaculaceae bacterium]|nr:T9SS type A sorting domain-containing protein [Muribaculaceae bacterium]
MIKKLLLSLCLGILVSASAAAQDVTTAKIKVDGKESSLGEMIITTGSQITFADGNMVVTTGDDTQSFSLDEIKEITFDLSMSAADNIEAELTQDLAISLTDGILTVTSESDSAVDIAVYNINGSHVASAHAVGTASIDLNGLAKGVYIIKANQKVIKFNR